MVMTKRRPRGSPGYTFPLMLVIITALSFGASQIEIAARYRLERDKEEELLFRGLAYVKAINAFHAKNHRYPREITELAGRGREGSGTIRQIYKDPMTGKDFQLIQTKEGAITGIVNSSTAKPFRTADFEKELEGFDKAKTYSDWKFSALAQAATTSLSESRVINASPD